MEDKLLYEITRFKQLSGLSLINEQGVIDNLLSLSGKRIKNVDDIINALNLSGKELTDTDIDKFCNELKGTGAMLDSELNLLRNELKANVKLRSALSKQSEDFVLAIKNTKNMKNLVGLAGVNILNKAQMMVILVKVTRELLDLTNSITRQSFDNIDNGFVTTLNKIFDNGFGLHNIDEIWDIIDGFILEKVNTSGLSPDLAEAQFKEFSKRIKENSKTKDLIDKFNSSGRNAGKPKRTTSVTKYSTDYKLPDGLLGAKTWVNVDEAGKGVKYSDSVPAKVDGDNLPNKVDDAEDVFDDYDLIDDGTGGGPDPIINEMELKHPGFFAKFGYYWIPDEFYNLLRSFFGFRTSRVYQQEVDKITNTLVTEFLPKFKTASNKITTENIDQFNSTVRQLLYDLKLAKPSGMTWDDLWVAVKENIRAKAGNVEGIDAFIKEIEQASGKESIEKFIEIMNRVAKQPKLFFPKAGERWALQSAESIQDWLGIAKFFEESSETMKNLKTTWKSNWFTDFIPQLFREIWSWFSGFLLYQAPRTLQRILNDISYAGITDRNLVKSLVSTYLSMLFVSYFFSPVWESLRTLGDTLFGSKIEGMFEYLGIPYERDQSIKDESGMEVLLSGYKEKYRNLIGMDLNLEDFKIVGKGPIIEAVMGLIDKYTNESPEEAKNKSIKAFNDEEKKFKDETIKENNERANKLWSEADNKEKKEIMNKNGYKKVVDLIYYGVQGLSLEQREKMVKSLDFIPGMDPTIQNDIENNTISDFRNYKKNQVPGSKPGIKNYVQSIKDVSGSIVIKDKNGIPYKVINRDGNLLYIEPSFNDLEKNPDLEKTTKPINTFADKL
jgi:hypothetical protein